MSIEKERLIKKVAENRAAADQALANDSRVREKISMGWTPLEAREIIDMEDGVLQPEQAELVHRSASDRPLVPTIRSDVIKTEKQKQNEEYLYRGAVEAWKEARNLLIGRNKL